MAERIEPCTCGMGKADGQHDTHHVGRCEAEPRHPFAGPRHSDRPKTTPRTKEGKA